VARGSGGNIRRRANGLWEARYRQEGRQRSVYASSYTECQAKLRQALQQVEQGIRTAGSRLTVETYLQQWLVASVRPRLRPGTIASYEDTVRRYIAPVVGRIPLVKLSPEDVSRMLARLAARSPAISTTTQRYAYAVLRIALGRAYKSGLVLRNVATMVDPLALRWQDLDLDAGTLNVRHTLARRTGQLAEPKTDRARRTLQLGSLGVSMLREQRRRQLEERLTAGPRWHDRDLVFTTRTGGPLDSRNVTQTLQGAVARLGYRRQRFHDLRHAYATLLLEDGVELAIISRSLGHADLSTTADVYSHLTPAMVARSASRMDVILSPRRKLPSG